MLDPSLNNKEKGFALIASLMVLVLMFVLAMALVYKVNTSVKTSSNWQNSQQSFIAAEAGIQAAKRYVQDQIDAGASISNTHTATVLTGFDNNGYPANGCLNYHPTQQGTRPGKLKSLTVEGALENVPPWTDLLLYHYFPSTISGSGIVNPTSCNSPPENYFSLHCEMDIDNATLDDPLNSIYQNYGYSYFIVFLGNWENISKKIGEELSSSSNLSQKKDYFYKVVSCGVGPNARNTIESIFAVEK